MEPKPPSPANPPIVPSSVASPATPPAAATSLTPSSTPRVSLPAPPAAPETSSLKSPSGDFLGPVTCPRCHIEVRPTDFFCYNCGAQIQEKPVHVSISEQLGLYLGSLILPPMGLIWGLKYYRKKGHQPKVVALIAVLITLVSLAVATVYSIKLMNQITDQVNERVGNLQAL